MGSNSPSSAPQTTPIAITGLSFRLPSDVKSEEEFWRFCSKAQSAWSEIPSDRFTAGGYYHQNADRLGAFTAKGGYFLREDVGLFDASFFGITAEEARSIDPQQRLILECAYEALESAGASRALLAGQRVGVFAGGTNSDYEHLTSRDAEQIPRYNVAGTAASFLANRLSHFFDFTGPSFTVDTACSSSLTALHVACQSLSQGESTHALVGSCHLNLDPDWFISFSSSSLLGPSGKCHSFDHRATSGYGRGEGAGCVFLRPLDAALADGDNILAVIANTGINQDGHTPGISMPSSVAQENLMRSVYASAGIDPRETAYVEAHGTGTKVGDPIETKALYQFFGVDRTAKNPLLIGSVKSNFGHAEGASGMISLIKTVLMLERGFILPNGGFEKAREDIPWEKWNLKVPRKLMPWPQGKPYASINNFGLGGANAHVILRKAPPQQPVPKLQTLSRQKQGNLHRIYLLSGNSEEAVLMQAKNLEVYLERNPAAYDPRLMYDLAYTLGERRTILPWKIAVSARTAQELFTALSAKETRPRRSNGSPKIAFVFTGQGAHWHAMGRELLDYPVFRETIEASDRYLASRGAGFSVVQEISQDETESRLSEPQISQSACVAIQIGLTALLRSWNIHPRAVIGHSSGEIAAAYAAGILSLEDAMHVAYERGLAAEFLQKNANGGMIAIGAPAGMVERLLGGLVRGTASIACINSGQNVTVSGDEAAVQELQEIVASEGIFHRRLNVNVAYHSSHMKLVAYGYLCCIRNIAPRESIVPFYSSARVQKVDGSELIGSYWVDNLVSPVQFAPALKAMQDAEGIDVLIEVGPHAALASAVMEVLQSSGHKAVEYMPTLRRNTDAIRTMHDLTTSLILRGQEVCLGGVNIVRPDGVKPSVIKELPRYPWDHKAWYWHSTRLSNNHLFKPFDRHDLLGSLSTESDDLEPRWRTIIRLEDHPWIKDHRVQGRATFPMTGFIAMAVEAARQCASLRKIDFDTFNLREVCIGKMLVVPDSRPVEITTSLRPYSEGTRVSSATWYEVRILSWIDQRGWDENFRGLISTQKMPSMNSITGATHEQKLAQELQNITALESACTTSISSESLYHDLEGRGFQYDRLFRNSNSFLANKEEAFTTVKAASDVQDEISASGLAGARMKLHPAVLDLFVHSLWPTLGAGTTDGLPTLYVPSYIKGMVVSKEFEIKPNDVFHACARRNTPIAVDRPVVGNIWVTNTLSETPQVLLQWEGLAMTPIHGQDSRSQSTHRMDSVCRLQMETCFDCMSSSDLQAEARYSVGSTARLDMAAEYYAQRVFSKAPKTVTRGLDSFYKGLSYEFSTHHVSLCQEMHGDPANTTEQVIHDFGMCLSDILSGAVQLETLVQRHGGLDKFYSDQTFCQPVYQQAAKCLQVISRQAPNLRVLEIGTSLAATAQIFQSLPAEPRFRDYIFAQISRCGTQQQPGAFILGKWAEHVQTRSIDLSQDPGSQDLQLRSFDIIVISSMYQARSSIKQTLLRARDLLSDGGKLIFISPEGKSPLRDFPVNLLTGGWPEEEVSSEALSTKELSHELWQAGFSGIDHLLNKCPESAGAVLVSSVRTGLEFEQGIVIVHDNNMDSSWLAALAAAISETTQSTPVVRNLHESESLRGEICVFVGELNQMILHKMTGEEFNHVKSLIQRSSGILWLTRGAYIGSKDPRANLISGLARTVRSELGIPFATLDLDNSNETSLKPLAHEIRSITAVFETVFQKRSVVSVGDYEFILRDGIISVPRVTPDPVVREAISRTTSDLASELQPVRQSKRPLRLEIQDYGMLDSLHFTDTNTNSEPPGENLPVGWIEIEVHCVGLNFRDIMHANNQIPVDGFGVECSGIVTAINFSKSDKRRFKVGDRVCAMADCCFSTRTQCPAACAWPIDSQMSFSVAASIPVVFTTAIYSLLTVGRLQAREKVLIHAAAGGVGQAAIMVAQAAGAEIFATVGSTKKKQLLIEAYGIPEDHIFFSRDLSFVDGIAASTQGVGVDVVLNSLAGEYLQASFECVAPFGRFVEIGKKDIALNSRLEMAHFGHNISFSAVDLSVFGRDRPDLMEKLMKQTFQMLEAEEIRPIAPLNLFDVSEVGAAFQALQSGQSMGKVIVQFKESSLVTVIPACPRDAPFLEAEASYIIIGGTGGLGRSITTWMAKHGAKHILLVSRSGPKSSGAKELIQSLAAQDVTVHAVGCDISDRTQVETVLIPYLRKCAPVRGVIHSAMVLRDAAFENMTWTDYHAVLKPKVAGVYHLNDMLAQLHCPLDFFVALSSIAGIVGNQGQSAYAAANTFLDAFSQYNHTRGVPFTSIDLAAMRDVGYLAHDAQKRDRVAELLGQDNAMDEQELHRLLTGAIHPRSNISRNAHILTGLNVIPIDSSQQQPPFWATDARFAYLLDYSSSRESAISGSGGGETDFQAVGDRLKRVHNLPDAHEMVVNALAHKIAAVVICPVDQIDASMSLSKLNLDSLSAIEVRKWISRELEASLQLLEILTSPSLDELARAVLTKSRLVSDKRKTEWGVV